MVGWDDKIPFERLKLDLEENIQLISTKWIRFRKKLDGKRYVYLVILYIQLKNGMRISEAVEAFLHWLKTGETEFEIRPRKTRKENVTRICIIPDFVKFHLHNLREAYAFCFTLPKRPSKNHVDKINVKSVIKFSKNWLGRRTHTNRKAWETYSAKLGIQPELLAKYQGRSNLNVMLDYIRKEEAKEEVKKKIINL